MAKPDWTYEKLDENMQRQFLPMNDLDGKITGHIVLGVKAWFDEHPEERKALGWIKHINHEWKEQLPDFDKTSQYLIRGVKQIDEYTIEDEWHAMPLSEEMMVFIEMSNALGLSISYGLLAEDGNGGIIYNV